MPTILNDYLKTHLTDNYKGFLEVLAIIAYKQPVTRVEIDDLRGVKSEGPIHTLISRGLIMEMGRSEGTGRAILYGTTNLFLDRFGLESIEGLPPLTSGRGRK